MADPKENKDADRTGDSDGPVDPNAPTVDVGPADPTASEPLPASPEDRPDAEPVPADPERNTGNM